MRVLCIDTEPETVAYLRSACIGQIDTVEMGYRTGKRDFLLPPHEFDLIVCDLRRPVCVDRNPFMLPFRPSKYLDDGYPDLVIYDKVTEQHFERERSFWQKLGGKHRHPPKTYEPKYQLLNETEIRGQGADRHNTGSEVLRAINTLGVPAILFLNPQWLSHVFDHFPNFFGLTWQVKRTRAALFQESGTLRTTFAELGTAIPLQLPLL